MSRLKTKLTYDDYAAVDDGQRYELIDGELCMVPAPYSEHQRIALRLVRKLDHLVQRHTLGELCFAPLDVRLTPHDVLQPDILFVSKARKQTMALEGLRGAPDLVIEILSPSTAQRDRGRKSAIYHRAGVREMWIVDPDERTIEVFLPGPALFVLDGLYRGDERVRSTVLPGLELHAREAFED